MAMQNESLKTKDDPFAPAVQIGLQASRPGNESSERSKSLVAQISCLRILALALLRQVENLEQRTADNQCTDMNVELQVRAFEAELIRSALKQTGGRQRRAARLLGMKVTTLNAKIRRYEIVFDRALTARSVHESIARFKK